MGRPKKSAGQRKEVNLIVRLLPEEKQELVDAHKREGEENLSAWVRKVLMAAARAGKVMKSYPPGTRG